MTTTAVACDSDEKPDAHTKVDRALEKLWQQKSMTMTLGFDATEDQIWSSMKGEKDFTREDAKILAGLGLFVSTSSDEPVGDTPADATSAFRISVGEEKDLLEARTIGEKSYVRADVERLLTLASDSGAGGEEADSMKEMLDAAGGLPSSYQSVKDLLGGKWVSMDLGAYTEFSKSMGEDGPGMTMLEPLAPEARKELMDALLKAVTDSAGFADAGNRDGADHVKVTVPADKAADAIVKGLKPLEKQLPDDLDLSELKNTPAQNIVLDLAIKDGTLSQVTVDVMQFEKDAGGKLPLTLGFSAEAAPVTAPEGAVALDPQDIMGAVMQLMMSGMGDLEGMENV